VGSHPGNCDPRSYRVSVDISVQEIEVTTSVSFHGEMAVVMDAVQIVQIEFVWSMVPDHKCIVNMTEAVAWLVGCYYMGGGNTHVNVIPYIDASIMFCSSCKEEKANGSIW
jgi:hypothetical protein